MSAAISPGIHASFSYTVTDADTAEALEGALEEGATTVGARVELEHLLATPVGAPVEVSATLERVEGRRLEFAVEVADGGRVAARGLITRVLVDLERFLAGVAARR